MMRVKSEYIAPQMSCVILGESDILTTSFDEIDNWQPDLFGLDEVYTVANR